MFSDKILLITGGTGALGAEVAKWAQVIKAANIKLE